jgi:iron complex transport system permease protein
VILAEGNPNGVLPNPEKLSGLCPELLPRKHTLFRVAYCVILNSMKKDNPQKYAREHTDRRHHMLLFGSGALLVLLCLLSLSLGRYSVPVPEVFKIIAKNIFAFDVTWTDRMEHVVLSLRLPRILGAALVGAALALSGATYQGVFHNPLVSPDILGVSSGACVGASAAIIANLPGMFIQLSALACGIGAVALSLLISKLFRQSSPLTLVLSGIIVSALCSSLLSLFQYTANVYDELPVIVFWTMGSLATVSRADAAAVAPAILIFGGVLVAMRWRINLLSLGGKEARTLGVNIGFMRFLAVLCSTVITASAVCVSGAIGWIGLIVPHLARLLVGSDNRYAIPTSALLGSSFLVVVDTVARNISSAEIPLSIITGLLGTPIFVFIVVRGKLLAGQSE